MRCLNEQEISQLLADVPKDLLIANNWESTEYKYQVENPATNEILATLSGADGYWAQKAFDAACAAQRAWAKMPAIKRADILYRAYALVQERAPQLATLMTLEMGKPITEAYGEVNYSAQYLRWYAQAACREPGQYGDNPEGNLRMLTQRKPVGPCLLITPWNFPLAMAARKVAPAIAAGCVMVLKTAQLTPLTAQYFAQIMLEAGLPAGVLNVISGANAKAQTEPILADSRLRKISFTGSTAVGKELLAKASQNVLRTSMELGGNAPFIVCADADLEAAVAGALAAKMRNIGEACTAANRFIVAVEIAAEFSQKLASAMAALKIGNGLQQDVAVGPLISATARENIAGLVHDAVGKGAEILTGGEAISGPGYFYQPTVLAGVTPEMQIWRQEIFGPVAPITTFTNPQEAITLANDTEFGLASYVYSSDINQILAFSEELEFGLVGANSGVISNAAAPFGGVKHSGMGKEGGLEGLAEYTTLQYIGMPKTDFS